MNEWDKRFEGSDYVYGLEPNVYFEKTLKQQDKKGKLLLVAEGEGRNAVYATKQGWDVFAFDISTIGRDKALKLAEENKVSIHYDLGNFTEDFNYPDEFFDMIGFFYAHMPKDIRIQYFKELIKKLKPNGIVVMEAFCFQQKAIQKKYNSTVGPKNDNLFYSKQEIENIFTNFKPIELEEKLIDLDAGRHQGKGYVLQFIGQKS